MSVRLVRDLRQDRLGGRAGRAAAISQPILRRGAAATFDNGDDFAVDDEAPNIGAHCLTSAEFDAFGQACG